MRSKGGGVSLQKRATALKVASAGKSKRQATYAKLKKRLDQVFSEWTRRRFADQSGMVRCITCQRLSHWKTLQNGHFIPRHYLAGRWHPDNCAPQCPSCNLWGRGRYPEYSAWGINHYGQDWLNRMIALKREVYKWSRQDLQQMIEDYETRLRQMEQ